MGFISLRALTRVLTDELVFELRYRYSLIPSPFLWVLSAPSEKFWRNVHACFVVQGIARFWQLLISV